MVAPNLLLHFDGANNATSTTDASTYAHTITFDNNAKLDTSQSKFGVSSLRTDNAVGGTFATRVHADGASDLAFGTGDFTVDFWVRFNSISGGNAIIFDGRPSSGANGAYPTIYMDVVFRYYVNATIQLTGSTVPTTGTWYHVAVTRASGVTRLFVNGTSQGGTYSDTTNYLVSPNRPSIGYYSFDGIGNSGLDGWVDELRVVTGTAAWTANFTPPTAPYSADPIGAGQADGFAAVIGGGPFQLLTGHADGQATAESRAGVPATGHADGYANVFSGFTPGLTGSPMLISGL